MCVLEIESIKNLCFELLFGRSKGSTNILAEKYKCCSREVHYLSALMFTQFNDRTSGSSKIVKHAVHVCVPLKYKLCFNRTLDNLCLFFGY